MGDASFTPDLEVWEPWRPDETAAALGSLPVPWAVAGGWAIDLNLGAETRPHDDIEVVVSRDSMGIVAACLGELEWFEVGDGCAWPLGEAPQDVRQTWGRTAPVTVGDSMYSASRGRDKTGFSGGIRGFDDHSGKQLSSIPMRFRISPRSSSCSSRRSRERKDEADLALPLPTLTPDRIEWLRTALEIVHPRHEWTAKLKTLHE